MTSPRDIPRTGPWRVLVVDDDPGIRVVLGRALERCGYQVSFAADGAAALEKLDQQPDVFAIVSDITMPLMNGMELAAQVLVRHPGTPILFVTSSVADPVLLANPLVGHVSKPVRVEAVRDALAALIEVARTLPAPGDADPSPDPVTVSAGPVAPGATRSSA